MPMLLEGPVLVGLAPSGLTANIPSGWGLEGSSDGQNWSPLPSTPCIQGNGWSRVECQDLPRYVRWAPPVQDDEED